MKERMELKRETVIDTISRFNRKSAELVVSGYNVNTGIVNMRPVITGVLYDKNWNPEKNLLYVDINQGADLRADVAETTVEILGEQSDPLEIYSLTDTFTGKTDGTLIKGRNAEMKGSYLKIEGDHSDCGVSFVHTTSKEHIKLAASDIVLNEPSRLMLFVPSSIPAGEYEISVTTQYKR